MDFYSDRTCLNPHNEQISVGLPLYPQQHMPSFALILAILTGVR